MSTYHIIRTYEGKHRDVSPAAAKFAQFIGQFRTPRHAAEFRSDVAA